MYFSVIHLSSYLNLSKETLYNSITLHAFLIY